MRALLSLLLVTVWSLGCAGDPPGSPLGDVASSGGPAVVFDILDKPLPKIPLPNDVATRLDDTSPTGRFINVSKMAPTFLESDTRAKANRLDGFGTFMPISVSFDAPLDLVDIQKRHGVDDDTSDDAVFLVDVDPNSPELGRRWPVDIGSGNFPIGLEKRNNYFENDGHRRSSNIMLETRKEDANGNGVLDPGEDTDWDGVLDRPNWIDPDAKASEFVPEGMKGSDPVCTEGGDDDSGLENFRANELIHYDNLASFWEEETNTLILRPVLPLRPHTQYAVVLTTRLQGRDGKAIRSPWPGKHHAAHADAAERLKPHLSSLGITEDEVAFLWTYTTGSTTRELEWIRAGLYGHGKMAWLADEYADDAFFVDRVTESNKTPYFAATSDFGAVLELLAAELAGSAPGEQAAAKSDIENIAGIVMGTFETPSFLIDRDGIATEANPANDDETIEIDPHTGDAIHGPEQVTWWCALPTRDEKVHGDKPFPTAIYGHGYTSSRVEMIAFAGRATRFGIALCGIDAFGHGLVLSGSEKELVDTLAALAPHLRPLVTSVAKGRARDLDNDGDLDSGGDFWTADIFHTRDVVRQSIVDHLRFIQLLRQFDGERTWAYDTNGDGTGGLAGDFDGDGRVDLGGPTDNYHMWGQSLGGILSGVLAGVEPALIDIGVRSRQGGVPEAVFLPLMGPFIVFNPHDAGGLSVRWLVNNVNKQSKHDFAVLEDAEAGDRIEVVNLNNGETAFAVVPNDGRFRIAIPADALTGTERRPLLGLDDEGVEGPVTVEDPTLIGDPIEIRVYRGASAELRSTLNTFEIPVTFQGAIYPEGAPLVAISKGLGLKRNSPSLRRMMGISQMILEGGDPVSYAPHYDVPLDFDYDEDATPGVNVLVIPTAGDMNVPVNTGIAMARAANMIELYEPNPDYAGSDLEGRSENRALIDTWTVESIECLPRWRNPEGAPVLFDIDDLSDGKLDWQPPTMQSAYGVPPLRVTAKATHPQGGEHGMRLPLLERRGTHGFQPPNPASTFDIDNYMNTLVYAYFANGGTEIPDHVCLEDSTCNDVGGPELPFGPAEWELQDFSTTE